MKVFFILNAFRGRKPLAPELVDGFRQILAGANIEHEIALSHSIEEARSLCDRACNSDFDTLWIGGGDGTINVLLNHTFGCNMTYGVVPMGTVNALARSFAIPLNPLAAARHLIQAKPHDMDVGQVNDTYFVCFASVGFDARVVHDVTSAVKRVYGKFAYVLKGVQAVAGMRQLTSFSIEMPEGCITNCSAPEGHNHSEAMRAEGHSFILSNICNYAGFRMFHEVQPCSGDMELFLFRHNRIATMLGWSVASVLKNTRLRGCFPTVGHYMVREFAVRSDNPMYLQLDGEAISIGENTHYTFKCHEKAIRLLV